MKSVYSLLISLLVFTSMGHSQMLSGYQPNAEQKTQIKRAYGMFMHFGVNTFNETEWSDGKLPASSYNPDKLNCDQWVKTAKESGFRYVILVTKHHDGFCLWNSKYTDYDVASSPVKTDIVKAVADACKKYGIQLGLYYSLWDRHEPSHNDKNPQAYVDYMKNQLSELLTNYGNIIEIWFDGGWAKKDDDWHIPEVYAHIKKLQPNCQVTVNHTIGTWGNITKIRQPYEMMKGDPIRFFPVDFRTKDPNLARWDDPKQYKYDGQLYYLPFEHTLCLSDRWNWFQKKDIMPARTVDELEELFYWCTANDNILIINVPPDQHGLIRENERLRILELADRLGIRNGKTTLPKGKINLLFNKPVTASDTSAKTSNSVSLINDYSLETYWQATEKNAIIEFDLQKNTPVKTMVLMEWPDFVDLKDGFSQIRKYRVTDYVLELLVNNDWKPVYRDHEIGACKILRFPETFSAAKIRLVIREASDFPKISHVAIYGNR